MSTNYFIDNINNNVNIFGKYIDISKYLHYFDVKHYEIIIQYHFIDSINGTCTKQVVSR